jgi:hypothetical protein
MSNTRNGLNFIGAGGLTIAIADNPGLGPEGSTDITITGGSGAGGVTTTITQTGHGFVVGNVLTLAGGSTFVKAKADSPTNAEVVGIVDSVVDANTFVIRTDGHIAGLSGLTAGTVYFLSDTTAGALQTTEPSTVGHVSKPLLIGDGSSSGYFFVWRGVQITAPGTGTSPSDTSGWKPLTTTTGGSPGAGTPELVWDADDNLVMTWGPF